LKIFLAAAIALPISGPKADAEPAYEAPNIIANKEIIKSLIAVSGQCVMILPAP